MKNISTLLIAILLAWIPANLFAQPANDECSNATPFTVGTPTACPTASTTGFNQGATTTLTGQTNVAATSSAPYPYLSTCGINVNNTPRDVWYSFVATGAQTTVGVSGATGTLTNPVITFWSGSCNGLIGMGCTSGTGGAASLTVYQTVIGRTYFIQVAGRDSTQRGSFTLTAACANNCAGCVLQSYVTPNPLPSNGTYAPGQRVQFCYTVTNWNQGSVNWLHGVTTTFGSGWDPSSLVTSAPASCTVTPAGVWSYYPTGQTSSQTGSYWGPGFYYETSAGNALAIADGNPGNNFGDQNAGLAACSPQFCITLTAFANDTPGSDLNITFRTSGDGQSGSWSSLACTIDPTVPFYNVSSCVPPIMRSLPAACNQSNGIDSAIMVGAYGPYRFNWSNGFTETSNGPSVITNLAPGVYTVTVTNALNCVSSGRDTVRMASRPYGGPDQYLSCPAVVDSVVMAAVGTGVWTALAGNPAAVNIHTPSASNTTISGFTALGTYNFIWAIGACTDTVAIIVNSRPNAGPDVTTCVQGTAALAATGTGTWTALAGNPSVTTFVNANDPHTTVSGFTLGGSYGYVWSVASCRDTAYVIVPVFTVSATGDTSLCRLSTTTLSVTARPTSMGPFTYLWLDSASVVSPRASTTLTRPILTTRPFRVQVTAANGCKVTDTVTVTLSGAEPKITITPSATNVCVGDTVTLTSTVIVPNLVSCGTVDTCPDNSLLTSATVGAGTTTSTTTTPYSGASSRGKTQYLFTAAELNAAGLSSGAITDVSFFVTAINSTVGYDSFSVSMGCTNLTTLAGGFVNTLMEVAPPAQVFPNLGWTPHPFQHYYNWDGASNLIVQVCYTRTAAATNNSDNVAYTAAAAGSVAYARSSSATASGCGLTSATASANRPNIRFGNCAPNTLTYQWSPATLLCDNCPTTQVVVTSNATYTLTVEDHGCVNDTFVRVTVNPALILHATPDTSICTLDTIQLRASLPNLPSAPCALNYFVSSIPFDSIYSATATNLPSTSFLTSGGGVSADDGTTAAINIGFPFTFYCQSYNSVYVNVNAWMSFINPYPATTFGELYDSQTFPPGAGSNDPMREIALMVADYNMTGSSNISYFVSGTAPNRVFVLKYTNLVARFVSATTTGEIHLHEGSNIIDVMLQNSNYSTTHTTGVKYGTGIGTAAPGRNNTTYTIGSPEGWRFVPEDGAATRLNNIVWTPNVFLSDDSIANPLATPPSSQTYVATASVTINRFTNPRECKVRDTATINIGSFNHTVTATPTLTCAGANSQLSFNSTDSVISYQWTGGPVSNPTIKNPIATVNDTTTFYVTAISASLCSVRDTITIYTYPYPQLTLGRDTSICYTDSVQLSIPGSYTSYEWYRPGTAAPIATTPTLTAFPRGSYILRVQDPVTSCFFFTDTIVVDSFAHPALHVIANTPLTFCTGGNVTLETEQGYSNYSWSPTGGASQSIPVTASGDYSYTATDANSCRRVSDTAHVVVSNPPVITPGPAAAICDGDTARVTVTTSPAGIPITWSLNGTVVANGDTLVTVAPGTYVVVASQGCPATIQVVVTQSPKPVVTLGPAISECNCTPSTVLTPVVTPSTGITYAWSTGTSGSSYIVDTVGSRTYTVTVTNANGCTASASQAVSITCFQVHAYARPDSVFPGGVFLLLDSPVQGGRISYLWTPSDSLSNPTFPSTKAIQHGNNVIDTFYLTAYDSVSGCSASSSTVVYVVSRGGNIMPTAFTPNGDGMNETMYPILAAGSHVVAFRVYNRWGQMVHNNPNAPGWGGDYGGTSQASDTYTYFLTVELPDPADPARTIRQTFEGSFQLFR